MPLYEYRCENSDCNSRIEIFKKISEHTSFIVCPQCECRMNQVPSMIAVHDDHPKWLNDNVRKQIQGDDNVAPIETRGDYERHCKERGIVVTDRKF